MVILKETDIQAMVLNYFRRIGVMAWRNNNTAVYDPKIKRFRRFTGLRGVGDIIGITREARFVSIEVKTEKEYKYIKKHYDRLKNDFHASHEKRKIHFQEQILFIEEIKKRGGCACFASGIDHVFCLLFKVFLGFTNVL